MTNQTIYAILAILIVITYLLMADIGGIMGWLNIAGPLYIPASRIGLYLFFFFLGVLMGSQVISDDAKTYNVFCFTASYKPSIPIGLIAILTTCCFAYAQINSHQITDFIGTRLTNILINGLFSISGMLLVMSVILIAKNYLARESRWLDMLNKDAYGIFIIHYLFVAWFQYLLINVTIPGGYKPLITTLLSIPLSWLISDGTRKIFNYFYFPKEI